MSVRANYSIYRTVVVSCALHVGHRGANRSAPTCKPPFGSSIRRSRTGCPLLRVRGKTAWISRTIRVPMWAPATNKQSSIVLGLG